MKTVDDVRQYFRSIVSGTRRPFSLVDNRAAFDCLKSRETELLRWAAVLSIEYDDLREMLTANVVEAAKIEHYESMCDLLNDTI
ncbi:hypothetical protein [Comamonas squillarum]|uniref:Uncharacterized protein n=1 Tax=Comamonas squillarum TaxID=2977320 RepID=A0ABY6A2Z0_9BURK|nr:hypothetical protein [Comamonas sp. PR12]UXC20016.1 hypothetical protein N4T19_07890 [Comamonas sp. PR12]